MKHPEPAYPQCCDAAKAGPVRIVVLDDDDRHNLSAATPVFWGGFRQHSERLGFETYCVTPAKFCPFCATPLPQIVLRDPPVIAHHSTDGYYCDHCKQRNSACRCPPPDRAYTIAGT